VYQSKKVASKNSKNQFPDSAEGGLLARGGSERVSAMTLKMITLEFVVPTALAIALGVVLAYGAVYLTDRLLGPDDQSETQRALADNH